jgi:hypothetical protein
VFTPRRPRLGDARPTARGRTWRLPLLILLAAVAFFLAGADLLWSHFQEDQYRPYRAGSGWALLALAAVQLRIALTAWRRREQLDVGRFGLRSSYWRWFLVGPVVCYLAVLLLGPERHARYLFRAALAAWFTLMLLPLVVPPRFLVGRWLAWSRRRLPRMAGNIFFALMILSVSAELALRVYAALAGQAVEAAYAAQQCVLPPGSDFRGGNVNTLGYWGDEFRVQRRPGVFRVAVLGDEIALSGSVETNFLNRIQRRLTDVEIYNFAVPQTGPREYAATLAQHVLAFQPDLVLTCFSVSDDVTGEVPLPGQFAWESLHLYHFGLRAFNSSRPGRLNVLFAERRDQESFLQTSAARLAVCRSPLDPAMRRCWQETLAYMSDLAATCRRHNVPLAFLAAPSEPQLDARLRSTLCRRIGCRPEEIDVELPQRQLAQFARQAEMPLIDLLPHFRRATQGVYGRRDSQWNDHGNELAADVLGGWLRGRCATRLAKAD